MLPLASSSRTIRRGLVSTAAERIRTSWPRSFPRKFAALRSGTRFHAPSTTPTAMVRCVQPLSCAGKLIGLRTIAESRTVRKALRDMMAFTVRYSTPSPFIRPARFAAATLLVKRHRDSCLYRSFLLPSKACSGELSAQVPRTFCHLDKSQTVGYDAGVSQGRAAQIRSAGDRQFRQNKARMSMKTKEEDKQSEAGADIALECLRCAEGPGLSGCGVSLDLSLRDIADPRHQGSAPTVDLETGGTKRECL